MGLSGSERTAGSSSSKVIASKPWDRGMASPVLRFLTSPRHGTTPSGSEQQLGFSTGRERPRDGIHRAEEFRCAITRGGIRIGSGVLEVSCSFGVASHAGEAETGKLILEADEALYSAKRAGRNRVEALSMSLS